MGRVRGEGVANYLVALGITTAVLLPLLLQALSAVSGLITRFISSISGP